MQRPVADRYRDPAERRRRVPYHLPRPRLRLLLPPRTLLLSPSTAGSSALAFSMPLVFELKTNRHQYRIPIGALRGGADPPPQGRIKKRNFVGGPGTFGYRGAYLYVEK
jgi:hypothetical protein